MINEEFHGLSNVLSGAIWSYLPVDSESMFETMRMTVFSASDCHFFDALPAYQVHFGK